MKMKTIQCPDSGEVSVNEFITFNQVEKYYGASRNDPEIAINALLMSIIIDVEITNLSINDRCEILKVASKELEFYDLFEEHLSKGSEYYIAFKEAFESSEIAKSIGNANVEFKNLGLSLRSINETMQSSLSSVSSMQEVTRAIVEKYKSNPIDISTQFVSTFKTLNDQLTSYKRFVQTNPLPLSNQFLTIKRIDNNLLIIQNDVFNKLNQSLSLSIAYLRETSAKQKQLIEPISIISRRFSDINNIFSLTNDLTKGIKDNIDKLNAKSKIDWYQQFSNLSRIIINTDASVGSIHDYFSESRDIRSLILPEITDDSTNKQDFSEIIESISDSETIIQDRIGSSLLLQNDLAHVIFNKLDLIQTEQRKYTHVLEHFEQLLNPQKFSEFLDEFAILVSREYWEHFWEKIGDKFKSAPESIAKSNLAMFLSGRYGRVGFIGQELQAGNGYIDLLVNLYGINNIVELKVIGATTPISWAEKGISQLDGYMLRYNLKESYLVIFDGRKTIRGKQINNYYDVKNGRVFTKTIKIFY